MSENYVYVCVCVCFKFPPLPPPPPRPTPTPLKHARNRHNSVAGAMKKLGNGANVGLTSGVLSTLGLSGLRRGSTAASAAAASGSSPANGHVALPGGQSGAVARQAAERVMEERDRLYVELKVRGKAVVHPMQGIGGRG